jgi:mRNA interferase MazF
MGQRGVDLVARFDVYLVTLDPTRGSEIQKTRPCVIVSPDDMNVWLRTVIVAPMTTTMRAYPSRVNLTFARKKGQVALDQIRTIDKSRLVRKLGRVDDAAGIEIATVLTEMFAIG